METAVSDHASYTGQLQKMQPQSGQITPAKAEYISRHATELHRPHWSGVRGADGRPATNADAMAYAHDRALQMGLREDSPEYFAAIDVVAPQSETHCRRPTKRRGSAALMGEPTIGKCAGFITSVPKAYVEINRGSSYGRANHAKARL
jgi:hypothetical protein